MAFRVIKKTRVGTSLGNVGFINLVKMALILFISFLIVARLEMSFILSLIFFILTNGVLLFALVLKTFNGFYINFWILAINMVSFFKSNVSKENIKYNNESETIVIEDNYFKVVTKEKDYYYLMYVMADESKNNKNEANQNKIIANYSDLYRLDENVEIKQIRIPVFNDEIERNYYDKDFFDKKLKLEEYMVENEQYLERIANDITLKTFVVLISSTQKSIEKSRYILRNNESFIELKQEMALDVYNNYLNNFDNAIIHDKYIEKDGYYYTNLTLYDLPIEVDEDWLLELTSHTDYCTMIDISFKNKKKVKRELNTSYGEKLSQAYDEKRNAIDRSEDFEEAEELLALGKEISKNIERIYKTSIKLWYCSDNLKDLQEKYNTAITDLDNNDYYVRGNGFMLHKEASYMFFAENRDNHSIDIESFTMIYGMPNNISIINDPKGIGLTSINNGYYVFNQFWNHKDRKSYSMSISGKKGKGKSTLIQKFAKDYYLQKNKVILLDFENENSEFVLDLGGINISVGIDSSYSLNIMEIYKVSDKANNISANIDRLLSFFEHFYKYEGIEESLLRHLLYGFYQYQGIDDFRVLNSEINKFPILSDFIDFCDKSRKNKFKEIAEDDEQETYVDFYKKFRIATKFLLYEENKNYFNTQTNHVIGDDDLLVNIELKDIVNQAQESKLAQAYLDTIVYVFIVLEMNANRTYNKNILGVERKNIFKTFHKARFLNIFLDEVHNLYNLSTHKYLDILSRLRKQDAKYLTAITDVLQNATIYTNTNGTEKERALNEIWANSTYRILFNQPLLNEDLIDNLFGENHDITNEVRKGISEAGQGEFLLIYDNVANFVQLERQPLETALFESNKKYDQETI